MGAGGRREEAGRRGAEGLGGGGMKLPAGWGERGALACSGSGVVLGDEKRKVRPSTHPPRATCPPQPPSPRPWHLLQSDRWGPPRPPPLRCVASTGPPGQQPHRLSDSERDLTVLPLPLSPHPTPVCPPAPLLLAWLRGREWSACGTRRMKPNFIRTGRRTRGRGITAHLPAPRPSRGSSSR